MDALLSINHGQKPAIYVETVETLEPTDATEFQTVKIQVSPQYTPFSALYTDSML